MKRRYDNDYHRGSYRQRSYSTSSSSRGGYKKSRHSYADPVNTSPSRVLHIRNLLEETTAADITTALSHFGNVAYVKMMANGHMALAEFTTMDEARECIEYSQSHDIMIRDHAILVNYSTSAKIQRSALESEEPSRVLVMTITNNVYPTDCHTIHNICCKFGTVYRIAFIKRPDLLQALVEFEDAEQATKAKYGLNGADIYDNACTLKIEFGRMNSVNVTTNSNAEQWDYTGDSALNPNNENAEHDEVKNEGNEWDSGNNASMSRDVSENWKEPVTQSNNYETDYRGRRSSSFRGRFRGGDAYDSGATRQGGDEFFNNDRRSNTFNSSFPARGGYDRETYHGNRSSRGDSLGSYDLNDERTFPCKKRYNERDYSNQRENGPTSSRNSLASYDLNAARKFPRKKGYDERDYSNQREKGPISGGDRFYDSQGQGRGRDRDGRERASYGSGDTGQNTEHGGDKIVDKYPFIKDAVLDISPKRNEYGPVLMVYGVGYDKYNCDRIFNLLCSYGNVMKVKFMHARPGTCLVQMGSAEQVESVISHLNRCMVFGTPLTFTRSKQEEIHDVEDPHSLDDGTLGFKNFTDSSAQRFSTPDKVALNIVGFPSDVIYWYDAPDITDEKYMKTFMETKKAPLPCKVEVLKTGQRSASGLMRFRSTDEANEAMLIANNMVIGAGGPAYIFKMCYASREQKKTAFSRK